VKWFLCVVLLALVISAEGAVIGEQYGMGGSQLIAVDEGHPLWYPTAPQYQRWVGMGVSAAASEIDLHAAASVDGWSFYSTDGIPCAVGRLHFAIVLTPELVGAVSGWEAARYPTMRDRIIRDPDGGTAEIAEHLYQPYRARDIMVILGVRRPAVWAPVGMNGAVYYLGEWRNLILSPRGSAWDYASDVPSNGNPSREWAGKFALAWAMYSPALSDPGSIQIIEARLPANPGRGPYEALISQVEPPAQGTTFRFVVGTPEEFAWLDF
jgi:hypothetical protein